jgi:CRISPR/Cas system-associated exonuclease Cas4 (RecB family)
LATCSKKFYLSQILKLDEQWEEYSDSNEIERPSRIGISDAKRGTRIHYQIENLIKGKDFDSNEPEIINWVKSELDKFDKDSLVSEGEIKFSFFGQMITGVPDLVVKKDQVVSEVWDFKTGLCDDDDIESYKFQLMTYAYGLQQVHGEIADSIDLKILLLDKKEIKTFTMDIESIKKSLFNTWSNLSITQVEKINHCASCQYGNLCHQ